MTIQTFHSTGLKLAAALVAGFIFFNTPTAAEPNQTEESFSAEVTKMFAYKYLKYLPEGYDGKRNSHCCCFSTAQANGGTISTLLQCMDHLS